MLFLLWLSPSSGETAPKHAENVCVCVTDVTNQINTTVVHLCPKKKKKKKKKKLISVL